MKITFMGAGSTVFARNVLGDCMCTNALRDSEIALYDIDAQRLSESEIILKAINKNINNDRADIKCYLGVENRKAALKDATFVVNAIQVGGYDPCTITDFEIPKKYGLKQTIADTMGIGGIMRALRTIPVMAEFAKDMEDVCPDAYFLNYTNPMAMLTGFMQRFTKVKTIGLCHSVQVCSEHLLEDLGMEDKLEGRKELIAGINHMGWLLELYDKDGNDLYPEIKKRAALKNSSNEKHNDMVRYEYIKHLGYYCTESSEHNAEYNPFFIKSKYPELIEKYNIPLDEYPRRCMKQIEGWEKEKNEILQNGKITHERSKEYASYIMEAIVTNTPYKIGGNVINTGLIDNLPADACVEVPCMVDAMGIHPTYVGKLPTQLAAMNISNINAQLLTIEAAVTKDRHKIYQAAMMDPHTAAELSIDDIIKMCDEMIEAHGDYMKDFN
ncbi:alpha-glucosidase/alpha-galactosidase [Candidatus Galacturonibacter soehngenii]|uniref:Alpha-glucosidase/alpha-galactosidase n=1 Tax=Candidatus Galacturonatibacter soehngenii TaxID=2307010 RepID=A0A7V7UBN9_9FIRM|nr:alpha-glucosidase/alpha-galactosidase [Candidatus Galacturonibacter soehngenii]KAB1437955.1 alpha-glucosidase/alpha-galactosidase [Candidatus Galacturonibacter soehngenii]